MRQNERDILMQLVQKVNDMHESMKAHLQHEEPILQKVMVHEERLAWVRKSVVALYTSVGSIIVGLVTAGCVHYLNK